DRPVQGAGPGHRARGDLPPHVAHAQDLSAHAVRSGSIGGMGFELSHDGRDFLRPEWGHVSREDPGTTVFHSPRYLKLYWEEFGADMQLALLFFEEQARTVGAAAIERIGSTI